MTSPGEGNRICIHACGKVDCDRMPNEVTCVFIGNEVECPAFHVKPKANKQKSLFDFET